MNDQRNAAKIEKAFVAPHARACAPRKNKGPDLAAAFQHRPAILRLVPLLGQSSGGGLNRAAKSLPAELYRDLYLRKDATRNDLAYKNKKKMRLRSFMERDTTDMDYDPRGERGSRDALLTART